jgi:presenilin-like A22 family membrane protease
MKHTLPVTLILISVFIASQLLGLGLIAAGTTTTVDEEGNVVVAHEDTALGPRPETRGFASFTYLVVGIAVGTIVLLILIKFNLLRVWKLWFFLAVWLAMTVSLGGLMHAYVAAGVALALAVWKIFRPNVIVHNLTEVLVYSGIALLVVPILDLFYMSLLLVVIAVYDAYAVWKSKHMVAMAKFQTESKLFAGLLVPYTREAAKAQKTTKIVKTTRTTQPMVQESQGGRNAILGGGDIAFPMLYTGVVMDSLLQSGLSRMAAFGYSLIVVAATATALFLLFYYAKKDRFYPAMPFLAAGCFAGYGILRLFM